MAIPARQIKPQPSDSAPSSKRWLAIPAVPFRRRQGIPLLSALRRATNQELAARRRQAFGLRQAGAERRSGGVGAGEIEIFPKGDKAGGENVIALPIARKSVALRREGDHFVEAPEPTGNSLLPSADRRLPILATGKALFAAIDHRREFLAEIIALCRPFGTCCSFVWKGTSETWRRVDEPFTWPTLATQVRPIGAYFPIERNRKEPDCGDPDLCSGWARCRTAECHPFRRVVQHTQACIAFGVSLPIRAAKISSKRSPMTRSSVAHDVVAKVWVGGDIPIELPLAGQSRFVTGFDDISPKFGPRADCSPEPGPAAGTEAETDQSGQRSGIRIACLDLQRR